MNIQKVKQLQDSFVVNDAIFVPNDTKNSAYQEIQEWIAQEGNVIEPEFTPEEFLQKAKDAKIAEIRAIKETELYKPVSYMSRIFISTERASGNIVGALQIISGDVFNWIDSNGNSITMTRAEFEGLGMAILVQRSAVYLKESQKYQEIAEAETIQDVQNITW